MIDLHTHSTCSDGSDAPARVVELAAAAGCSALALTDHDGFAGLAEAERRAGELGITFVPGCEVSCRFDPGSMHVLCYFVADAPGPLQDALVGVRIDRTNRNRALLTRLSELGIELDPDELAAEAGSEVVGRPHFAALLVRHGYVDSIAAAFDRYLAKGAPAYVERAELELDEVLELAAASGALPVLAHPLTLGLSPSELDAACARYRELGLGGLECHYSRYRPEARAELVGIARRNGLVPTGGSDYHGEYKPGLHLGIGEGDLAVPEAVLDELLERAGLP